MSAEPGGPSDRLGRGGAAYGHRLEDPLLHPVEQVAGPRRCAWCLLEVLAHLADGHFNYTNDGLLDATHIRFFTYSGILRLLDGAGFELIQSGCSLNPPPDMSKVTDNGNKLHLGRLTISDLSRDEVLHLCAFQYYFLARRRDNAATPQASAAPAGS